MCTYFKTETDVAQNPLDEFFSNFDCQKTFRGYGGTGLLSEKTEALHAELNERAEAATSSYSAEVKFLQYIYSVLVAKNHYKIRLRCSVYEFSFTDIF